MADDAAAEAGGDEFVRESFSGWTPRFIANGIDFNDLERIRSRIDTWADWCEAFTAVGEMHADLGEAALEDGRETSAGEHFTRASMYFHFGSHVWHEDEAVREAAHARSVDLFTRGGARLDPPIQRVEAPYEPGGFDVPGYLCVPEQGPDGDVSDSPLVVLMPGLDSTKEELYTYADEFLARGVAVLSVDGAGQGETREHHPMSVEYPALISALLDHVEALDVDGLDPSRLATYGVSLGGYYAPQVAAHDDRVDACVGISGVYSVGPVSKSGSDLVKQQFRWACKTDSMVEVDDITEEMSLRTCIDDLTCPTLMITGDQDTIVYPEETERIAAKAPNAEYVLYEGGNHVCNNVSYKYKPMAADWVVEHVA